MRLLGKLGMSQFAASFAAEDFSVLDGQDEVKGGAAKVATDGYTDFGNSSDIYS